MTQTLKVWVPSDPHVTADIAHGRESLGDAIRDSEADFNDWDFALCLGDFTAGQSFPTSTEFAEVVRQFGALQCHDRAQIYTLQGNHDRGPRTAPCDLFCKYVDPLGENTVHSGVDPQCMPYAVSGTWDNYRFQVGNLDFIMLSDVTRPNTSLRGYAGGDPGGVISEESYQRWIDQCDEARNNCRMVLTGAHYMPRNTTAYTYDGGRSVPAHGPGLISDMASYFAYVGDHPHKYLFREYMEQYPGICALWLGGHNHLWPGDDPHGRGQHGSWYGTYFVQCSALTNHHGAGSQLLPRSRIFTFTDGSDEVLMETYVHLAKGSYAKGFVGNGVTITLPMVVEL